MSLNKRRRKNHFKLELLSRQRQLWNHEFLLAKARAEREGFRMEYDRMKERLEQVQQKLEMEREKKQQDTKILKNLKKLLRQLKPDVKQLEERLKALDVWIEGPKVDPDTGMDTSIKAAMDSLRSVIEMLKDYRSKL